ERLLADAQKAILGMPGPDAWSGATFQLETIAQRERDAGDWGLAGFTAKNMIEHDGNYAGGYYAMALVAGHSKDTAAESKLFDKARRLWSKADADLAELAAMGKDSAAQAAH
ncbi:MAG TPA: hypothetical protein VFN20_04590, partial [Candidatus Acidoferrum sp.]|nr:hypothetical protein [Candidatus Acidoferrum sp.]